jgi:hypothetical protein
MSDAGDRLRETLADLRARARSARYVRLSATALLGTGVLLMALLGFRRYRLDSAGADPFGMGPVALAVLAAVFVGLVLLAVRFAVLLAGPRLSTVARRADARLDLRDLVISGFFSSALEGPFAVEVVRRAAAAVEGVDPARLYPTRAGLLRHLAAVPLLLAALYLFALPPWEGLDPFRRGSGEGGVTALPDGSPPRSDGESSNRREAGTPPAGRAEETAESIEPAFREPAGVVVIPARRLYERDDPVTLFVVARAAGEPDPPRRFAVSLAVDDVEANLEEEIVVGPDGSGVLTVRARYVSGVGPKLTPGKHTVQAVLSEEGRVVRSEPVEIEIRGDPGGEPPKPEPEPKPEPASGEPPPPETEDSPRFVTPLFGPGETVQKKGYALVPDPTAPPGSPPRRMPLDEAAREAGRRTESAVATENVGPEDREAVTRYFDLLRGAK